MPRLGNNYPEKSLFEVMGFQKGFGYWFPRAWNYIRAKNLDILEKNFLDYIPSRAFDSANRISTAIKVQSDE